MNTARTPGRGCSRKEIGLVIDNTRVENIIRSLEALIPDCGKVHIQHGNVSVSVPLAGFTAPAECDFWFLYVEDTHICKNFHTLDDLERYVISQIHGLKLLMPVVLTPKRRAQKDNIRRMFTGPNGPELN